MRAHVIKNDIVVNTIEVDSMDFMPNLVDATYGSIGWTYKNGKFSPPPQNEQAKPALDKNQLLQDIAVLTEKINQL